MKDRLEWIIFYFEGTCEICLGNRGIDKYRNEINNLLLSKEDYSDEIVMLIYYAKAVIEYKLDNIEDSYQNWLKSYAMATRLNDQYYIAKICSYFAIYFYIKKDKQQELKYFNEAIRIFKDIKEYGELAIAYINILWYKRYEEDTLETIEYMDEALKYAQLSESQKNARVYLHLGYIHKTIFNDFIKGIKYLIISNDLCRKNGFVEMESMTFHVLADGYLQLDHYYETIGIYTQILNDERYANITSNLKSAILLNLINCYLEIKDIDNAQKYLNQLTVIIDDTQINIKEQYYCVYLCVQSQINIFKKQNLQESLSLLQECQTIYDKYNNGFIVDDFAYKLLDTKANLYVALNDYKNAIEYYSQLVKISKKYNLWLQKEATNKLAQCFEEVGDFINAIYFYKNSDALFSQIEKNRMEDEYTNIYNQYINAIREQEISELMIKKDDLSKNAQIDNLTKIFNRNYYDAYINKLIENHQNNVGVLMIDVDYFKRYNDNYGHVKGDEILTSVAAILNEVSKEYTSHVIRLGGDEFIVFVDDTTENTLKKLADELLISVEEANIEHLFSYNDTKITLSIGISLGDVNNKNDVDNLLLASDKALYEAKANGRNQSYFSQEYHNDCMDDDLLIIETA